MAQTIKIKRSTGSSAPSTLANGELAYLNNSTTKKLYIGRPGGGTGDIDVIGGKYYTDVIDARTANSEAAVATTNTSSRTYKVQKDSNDHSVVNVPWVDTNTVYTLPLASSSTRGGVKIGYTESGKNYPVELSSEKMYVNVPWTDTSGDNKLPLAGGTLTGNIVLGDDNKVQFGGTTTNLQIYNDGAKSYIKENASGNLEIHATDFTIMDGGGQTMMSFDADGVLRLYDQQTATPSEKLKTQTTGIYVSGTMNSTGIKLGNETVIVDSIKDEDNMSSNDADSLATQQSIKAYVDASVPTSVATATNATNAANVTLSADNSTNASHYIPFANSATGNQGLQTDSALVYNPSTNGLSVGTSGNIATGTLSVSGDISVTGTGSTLHGPSTFYIDPAPDDTGEVGGRTADGQTTDTGTVVILGDLRVTGETTTVNSTTVSVGDNEIVLNGDHTGTPTLDAGIRVERGSQTDAWLNWDESEGSWVVNEAQSSSPYFYTLLHSNNFETAYTGNIDGGTF